MLSLELNIAFYKIDHNPTNDTNIILYSLEYRSVDKFKKSECNAVTISINNIRKMK